MSTISKMTTFQDLAVGETFMFADADVMKIFRKLSRKSYVKADMNTPIPTSPNSIVDTHVPVISTAHIFSS